MLEKLIREFSSFIFKNDLQKDNFLKLIFRIIRRDPLLFAYNNMGILNYQNEIVSGEKYLIEKILPLYFSTKEKNIFFDVGANKGSYSANLAKQFPTTTLYSFEPNKSSFKKLKEKVSDLKNIKCFNHGFSDQNVTSNLFTYSGELDSQHASLFKEVLSDIHSSTDVISMPIELLRLDDFCQDLSIHSIDFLKIDTEGNEIDVLKGASKMIKSGKIGIIQFEFNEMNIISRVFLKDFYNLLVDYKMFRLNKNHLLPMALYNSTNEIFKFQNLVAIHKGLLYV